MSQDVQIEQLDHILERLVLWQEACTTAQSRLLAELSAVESASAGEKAAKLAFEAAVQHNSTPLSSVIPSQAAHSLIDSEGLSTDGPLDAGLWSWGTACACHCLTGSPLHCT